MGNNSYSYRSIKGKLVAATCMLLVSCIMVVSSTYAWFTLSTAPEVTGIQTAVGANGNLEMALLPTDGDQTKISSAAGDSTKPLIEKNVTWGNLVALKDEATDVYGMTKMVLYPAKLNVASWAGEANKSNPTALAAAMLSTPKYGADGRVSEVAANTTTSTYNTTSKNFPGNGEFGVRAVGVASGMTDRQLAYRNTRSAANTAASQAKVFAAQSLNTNGAALANVAIKKATNSAGTYEQKDVASLQAIVNDLLGYKYEVAAADHTGDKYIRKGDAGSYSYVKDATGTYARMETGQGVLDYVEEAYIQYIRGYVASQASGLTETEWNALDDKLEDCATLEAVLTEVGNKVPDGVSTYITALQTTVSNVESAATTLEGITKETGITWDEISIALNKLANVDAMKINGIQANTLRDEGKMSELVSSVTNQGGLTVTMATGGGVYADIADHCGDYNAQIIINEVTYGGVTLNNMKARMDTDGVTPHYLSVIGLAVDNAGAPATDSNVTQPITDMYGYVIDLAFRTNASDSNLLLQTEATDRIYSDNDNENTMGGGSSMTFTATTTDFDADQIKRLMGSIRAVFFDPKSSNRVLATAKLDVDNATTVGGNTVTAKLYLYETNEDGTETMITTASDSAITSLAQNTAATVSVLVYLDGEKVTNADVAATGTSSATGTMNLQFASSATLQPMEYKDLHISDGTGTTPEPELGENEVAVTVPAGITGANKATKNEAYSFTVGTGYTLGTVTVGGTEVTPTAGENGAYTIPADKVTDTIVISATANQYTVKSATENGSDTEEAKATHNTAYVWSMYTDIEIVSVTVGDTPLTAGTDYTVDAEANTCTIKAEKVTGNIRIVYRTTN